MNVAEQVRKILRRPVSKRRLQKTYQGWTNRETWNLNLWAMNEEPIYREIMAHRPYTAESAEALAYEIFPHGTPDMKSGHDLTKVNWVEIAEAWNEK